jgi:hypothetical protein
MNDLGIWHVVSLGYLSVVVALVISVNDSETPRSVLRGTARRTAKLLGALGIIALAVWGLSLLA